MDLKVIIAKYRAKEIDATTALNKVQSYLMDRYTRAEAEAFVTEILELPAEVDGMSDDERQAAEAWENGYRGS